MSLAGHRDAAGPAFEPAVFTNRFEVKYPSSLAQLADVEARLDDYLARDETVNEGQGYHVASVYFDSPNLRFYRDKMEGELTRLKPRLRWYRNTQDAEPNQYFLELKGRYDRIVLKRRTALSPGLAKTILNDPLAVPDTAAANSSVLGEFSFMVQRFNLRPVVTVAYHRQPFRGRYHNNLRVTFDRMLRASLSTTLDVDPNDFAHFLAPNRAIVELKYNEVISRYLLQRLHSLGMIQQTYSKYAQAVGALITHNSLS